MTRQGSTKEKILRLISKGDNTLSMISGKLELAPSTVSKHIHDLESTGAISQISSEHIKKWKYYRVNQDMESARNMMVSNRQTSKPIINSKIIIPATAGTMALILIAAIYFYTSSQVTGVPISITDPPQVPQGTQALYINYSSLTVHITYDGQPSIVAVNSSGRINLMSIINESQVIGTAEMKPNSTIDSIAFNVTNASIVIDNVTYPVSSISTTVSATLESNHTVNSTSGILLDFSPVVVPVYTRNSSNFTFIMLPSVRAAVTFKSHTGQGSKPGSMSQMQQQYKNLFTTANVTVTGVKVNTSANQTTFSVTVGNEGSKPITVFCIVLHGQLLPYLGKPNPYSNSYYEHNSSMEINASTLYNLWSYYGNGSVRINIPRSVNSITVTGLRQLHTQIGTGQGNPQDLPIMQPDRLGFFVDENATLSLETPPLWSPNNPPIPGFVIAPHSSQVFTYHGEVDIGDAAMNIANQSSYNITVVADQGIASANISSR